MANCTRSRQLRGEGYNSSRPDNRMGKRWAISRPGGGVPRPNLRNEFVHLAAPRPTSCRLRCSETCKETRLVGFSYTLAKCQFCPTTSSIPERAMPVQAGPPQKTPWWIAAYSPLSLRRLLMQPGAGHNRPSDPPDHDPFDF